VKDRGDLTAKQREDLAWLARPSTRLATARARRWREDFQALHDQPADKAEACLRRCCRGAKRSRLEPVKDFARMVEDHWDGILAWRHTM
jgi:DNA/RNA-binding domain of Phe-tRNA-synthetase-like protein